MDKNYIKFKFCPICKGKLKFHGGEHWFMYCIKCKVYINCCYAEKFTNRDEVFDLKWRYGFPTKDLAKMGFTMKKDERFDPDRFKVVHKDTPPLLPNNPRYLKLSEMK